MNVRNLFRCLFLTSIHSSYFEYANDASRILHVFPAIVERKQYSQYSYVRYKLAVVRNCIVEYGYSAGERALETRQNVYSRLPLDRVYSLTDIGEIEMDHPAPHVIF